MPKFDENENTTVAQTRTNVKQENSKCNPRNSDSLLFHLETSFGILCIYETLEQSQIDHL